MKYLKTYENYDDGPQVGDYVIVDPYCVDINIVQEFFKIAVGQLVKIVPNERLYYVQFDNVPIDAHRYICDPDPFRRKSFIAWGKTKEDAEMMLQANKYNL